MTLNEPCLLLERSLERTAGILREMLRQLEERRLRWASARPQEIRPPESLEQLAEKLAGEEVQQRSLLERMAPTVGLTLGVRPAELHLNVSKLAALLQSTQARSLKAAAAETTKLSTAIRTEVMLGERLLHFTRDAQDRLFGQLASEGAAGAGVQGYDHRARARVGPSPNSARLVDGRI